MHRKHAIVIASAAAAVALGGAAPAAATTFCVPSYHAACPNGGGNVAQANLETAMASNGSDGIADTVLIAAGTFTDANSLQAGGTDPLTVRGAGPGQTILTTSSSGNIYVVDLNTGNSRAVDVHDLTIDAPPSLPDGLGAALQQAGDTLDNVDIEVRNPGTNAIPSWPGGGTFRSGRIFASGAGQVGTAVSAGSIAGAVTIEDTVIEDATTPVYNSGATQPLSLRRVRVVDPAQSAVQVGSGTVNIENSVFEMTGPTALYLFVNSAADATVNADHVTIRNDGSGSAAPVGAQVGGGMVGDANLVVRSSILRGYPFGYLRTAPTGIATGDANLTIAYSNRDPGVPATSTGDGSANVAVGNATADPQLSADLSLPAGSAAIDAADPASTLTTDFLGAPRPVDGDGVAGAASDQGAFEYQPPPQPPANPDTTPPDTVADRGPKRKSAKRKATFRFSSEPGATFSCRLDQKQPKPCTSPVKVKRLKRGKHVFEVTATDAAGNADPTPARFRFKVVRKRG